MKVLTIDEVAPIDKDGIFNLRFSKNFEHSSNWKVVDDIVILSPEGYFVIKSLMLLQPHIAVKYIVGIVLTFFIILN